MYTDGGVDQKGELYSWCWLSSVIRLSGGSMGDAVSESYLQQTTYFTIYF